MFGVLSSTMYTLDNTTGDSEVSSEARARASNFLLSGAVTQGILSHQTSGTLPATSLWLELSLATVVRHRLEKSWWLESTSLDSMDRWRDMSMGKPMYSALI